MKQEKQKTRTGTKLTITGAILLLVILGLFAILPQEVLEVLFVWIYMIGG